MALTPDGKLYMTARNARADLRRNELHEREWTAGQLVNNLNCFDTIVMVEVLEHIHDWEAPEASSAGAQGVTRLGRPVVRD